MAAVAFGGMRFFSGGNRRYPQSFLSAGNEVAVVFATVKTIMFSVSATVVLDAFMGTSKGRGWRRRIGIVVSVIWFIAFGGYLLFDTGQRIYESYSSKVNSCFAELNDGIAIYARTPKERVEQSFENPTNYGKCQADAKETYLNDAGELYRSVPIIVAVDLAMILLGWTLVWLTVFVVRWKRCGFASA